MDAILQEILSLMPEEDFALFYYPGDSEDELWRADIGNPSQSVCLGEIGGKYRGEGATATAALEALLRNLKADKQRKLPDWSVSPWKG